MAQPDKAAAVAELGEQFRNANGAVLTDYRGLSVKQLQELRRSLGDNADYAVVKNRLTKVALRENGIDGLDDLLAGPSAIAFIKGDAVEVAKSLRDFAKANPELQIKGGLLEGRALAVDEINRFADLESREVVLSKLAGALNASLSQAASLFAAPLSKTAQLAEALRAKVESEGGAAAGAAAGESGDEG